MKKATISFTLVFVILCLTKVTLANDRPETTYQYAIDVANREAKKLNYDPEKKDIEVLKVKKGIERGPVRLSWLLRYFPYEERKVIWENEFWIVYFYPKGNIDEPAVLGGEFCVLVDLYSGKTLLTLEIP